MSLEAALQATTETNLQLISVLNQFLSHFRGLAPETTLAEHTQATVATNGASSPSAPLEDHSVARAEAAAEQAVSAPPKPDTAGVTPPTYQETANAVILPENISYLFEVDAERAEYVQQYLDYVLVRQAGSTSAVW